MVFSLLAGDTISQAAQKAGISDRQVSRWLKEPAFVNELHQAERQVLDACAWNLVSMAKGALDALKDVLEEPASRGANVKRLAAVSVLELALKYMEVLTFEERLQAVERQVFNVRK